MIGWLIALALFICFLMMRVGVRFLWKSEASVLKIRLGFLRFSIPAKKGEKQSAEKPIQAAGKKKTKGVSPALKKWLSAVFEHRLDLLSLIGRVLRSPVLDLVRLHIAVGASDSAACALTYGRVCAGLSAGLPVLYNSYRVKKQDIDVSCRFDLPKMVIMAEVETTLKIHEILALIGVALGLLLKLYRSTKTIEKAVQNV